MQKIVKGMLYVVATPIGNLSDMSARAIEILQGVDLICAEDTRTFKRLALEYAISTKVRSYHDHSEEALAPVLVEALQGGQAIALVSEAGTPTINDPGFRLIRACRENGVPVSPIPGATAAMAALSVSGFETDQFYFAGFVPVKNGRRRSSLEEALERNASTIYYESPHRILKSLNALSEIAPERKIFIGRELTKLHEECLYGTTSEITELLAQRNSVKGELVLIIGKKPKEKPQKKNYS